MDANDLDFVFEFFSWTAVFILAVAYWLQVIKIHKHKEVRDLSLISYSILSVGYFILLVESSYHFDADALAKAIAVLIPCLVILVLINHNKHCEWVDKEAMKCFHCGKLLQPYHMFCSACGKNTTK